MASPPHPFVARRHFFQVARGIRKELLFNSRVARRIPIPSHLPSRKTLLKVPSEEFTSPILPGRSSRHKRNSFYTSSGASFSKGFSLRFVSGELRSNSRRIRKSELSPRSWRLSGFGLACVSTRARFSRKRKAREKREGTLTRAGGRGTRRRRAARDRRCWPSIVCRTRSGSASRGVLGVEKRDDITYARTYARCGAARHRREEFTRPRGEERARELKAKVERTDANVGPDRTNQLIADAPKRGNAERRPHAIVPRESLGGQKLLHWCREATRCALIMSQIARKGTRFFKFFVN